MAIATPLAAPHTPKAFARSLKSSKAIVRVERVAGKMKAADAPMSALATSKVGTLCEKAARSENAPNATRAVCMTRLRPSRSDNPPPARRRPAKGREYASTIHCRDEFDAWRSRDRTGRATFTIVLSMTTIITTRQRIARIHHLRSWVEVGISNLL
jgi:hypothetical protein